MAEFLLTTKAIVPGLGNSSRTSAKRFGPSSPVNRLTPVALPPGRLKLTARPIWTGSNPLVNTIGIVAVAPFCCYGRRPNGGNQHSDLSTNELCRQHG